MILPAGLVNSMRGRSNPSQLHQARTACTDALIVSSPQSQSLIPVTCYPSPTVINASSCRCDGLAACGRERRPAHRSSPRSVRSCSDRTRNRSTTSSAAVCRRTCWMSWCAANGRRAAFSSTGSLLPRHTTSPDRPTSRAQRPHTPSQPRSATRHPAPCPSGVVACPRKKTTSPA